MSKAQKGYSKSQRRRINAARETGRAVYGDWLKRKIDRSFQHEATPAAKLPWLDQPKSKPQPIDPKWSPDDLESLRISDDLRESLRRAGLNTVAKVARAEAFEALPTHLDQPAIAAALTTWVGTTEIPCCAPRSDRAPRPLTLPDDVRPVAP